MLARRAWSGAFAGIICCAGCGIDFAYLLPAAVGQWELLCKSVPISQALESGELTDEQAAKLRLIQDARAYARDVLALNVADNFTRFYNSGGEPVAFNVSASRKDQFAARTWWFPIVGTVPYLGYFDRNLAEAKREELRQQGHDVFMYEIEAYSGISLIPNLVLSPMLRRSDSAILETVFHELLHSTIWRMNDTSFNESLATFYGRTGAISYIGDRFPDDPDRLREANEGFEDVDRITAFLLELYQELDAFYSTDLSYDEKVAGREGIYQSARERYVAEVEPLMYRPDAFSWLAELPPNNAFLLGVRRYNLDVDLFARVWAATGQNWPAANSTFLIAVEQSEPYEYLRQWVSAHETNAAERLAQP